MNKLFIIFFALFLLLGEKTYSKDFHQKESFSFPVVYSFKQAPQLKIILPLFNSVELNDLDIDFEITESNDIVLSEITENKPVTVYLISFQSSFFTLFSDLPPPILG